MMLELEQTSRDKIRERNSEGDSKNSMVDDSVLDNQGGMTIKQLKAQEKLQCYQKGWERMNRYLNRPGDKNSICSSLIDKQERYTSPREDCLSSFYESTQKSVSMCPNERKRSTLITQAVRDETLKFDNEKSRQSFIG